MDINQLLSLEHTISNAKKIDQFLAKTPKDSFDYLQAFCFKMEIWGENKRINDALKEVYNYVPYFSTMVDEEVIIICNTIMKLTLKASRLDEYQKYMQIKVSRLPASRLKEKHYDAYFYYYALKDYKQARVEANAYLNFNLTKEEKIQMNLELLKISELLMDEKTFMEVRNNLEYLYKDSFDFKAITNFHIRVLKMLFLIGKKKEALDFGIEFLTDSHLENDDKIIAATIILKIYLENKEYNKATIFEADYAEILSQTSPKIALDFAKTALLLYEKVNHKISVNFYEEIIVDLETKLKALNKENKKQKNETIVIPEIVEQESPKISIIGNNLNEVNAKRQIIEIVEEKKKEVKINNLEIIDLLESTINFNNLLRDSLRNLGIKLEKNTTIKEIDVVYKHEAFYHHKYKNERVYDRKYVELPNSWQKKMFDSKKEAFFTKKELELEYDLFYAKEILYDYAYLFPLYYQDEIVGILTLYSLDNLLDAGFYEILKLVSLLINESLAREIKMNKQNLENDLRNYIFSNSSFGYKIFKGDYVELSPQAMSLLSVDSDTLELKKFYQALNENDKNKYSKIINDLFNNPHNNETLIYSYEKNYNLKFFKEIFFSYYADELIIVSIFFDITSEKLKFNDYEHKIYHNLESGLGNKVKLFKDLDEKKHQKYLLGIFSLVNIKDYIKIYGYKFYSEFVKILGRSLKEYFKNNYNSSLYQIDEELFSFLINTDLDKRIINTKLKQFMNFLDVSFINLSYNIPIHFSLGVYRKTAFDSIKENNEVFDYAYDTFILATEEFNGESNYLFFNLENYKKHFKEKVIETSIKESLDGNRLDILYQQVVDIENLEVFGYYAGISIKDDIYSYQEIDNVIRKWDLKKRIDKYKLTHIGIDLKKMFLELKAYVDIFVELDGKTISKTLSEFIYTQLSFFKVPTMMIKLIVDEWQPELENLKKLGINIITRNIYDVINGRTNLLLLDYKKIDLEKISKLLDYLAEQNNNVIIENVPKIEISKLKNQNIKYLIGEIYPKKYTMSQLIEVLKNN